MVEVATFRRDGLPVVTYGLGRFRGLRICNILLKMRFSILDLVNSKLLQIRNQPRVQAFSLESARSAQKQPRATQSSLGHVWRCFAWSLKGCPVLHASDGASSAPVRGNRSHSSLSHREIGPVWPQIQTSVWILWIPCHRMVLSPSTLSLALLGQSHGVYALCLPLQVLHFALTAFTGCDMPGEIVLP